MKRLINITKKIFPIVAILRVLGIAFLSCVFLSANAIAVQHNHTTAPIILISMGGHGGHSGHGHGQVSEHGSSKPNIFSDKVA